MRSVALFLTLFGLLGLSYMTAQDKIQHELDVKKVHLGMSLEDLSQTFGSPIARNRNRLTYILPDASELIINLRDDVVASAKLKYHRPLKIEGPELKKLTLVQMDSENLNEKQPSWFFAGKPEEGLIYKVTALGTIESMTWIRPFTYGFSKPKQLQALLREFKIQNLSNL